MSTEKFRKLESVDEYKTIQKNMRHNITTLFSNIFFLPVDIEHYITSGRALLRELDKGFILLLEETKYYKLYIYADVEQQIVIEPFDKKIVFRYMYREEKGRAVLPHIEEQFRKNGFLKEGTLVYISGNAEELFEKCKKIEPCIKSLENKGYSYKELSSEYYEMAEEMLVSTNIIKDYHLEASKPNITKKCYAVVNGLDEICGVYLGYIEGEVANGAIMVKGSDDPNEKDYSVVNVGKDVTLEGWSGIFITHDNYKSYGVDINFAGTINAIDDTTGGTGAGIYINGNIKDKYNSPVVNIQDGAKINSTGNGLYIAGYGTYNINEANISGVESGIGIKAGILNIDGATVTGTGPDATPTEGYNNGIKASGTSIQIESNNGYAGNIEINIDNGTFVSNHSNVLYEYIGKGTSSQVIALDVSRGTFVSNANKDVIRISDSLKEYHNSFISGGKYSSNPNEYLKPGYTSDLDNGKYVVTKSTMKPVISTNIKEGDSTMGIIFIVSIITLSIFAYLYINRTKVLNFLRK